MRLVRRWLPVAVLAVTGVGCGQWLMYSAVVFRLPAGPFLVLWAVWLSACCATVFVGRRRRWFEPLGSGRCTHPGIVPMTGVDGERAPGWRCTSCGRRV